MHGIVASLFSKEHVPVMAFPRNIVTFLDCQCQVFQWKNFLILSQGSRSCRYQELLELACAD